MTNSCLLCRIRDGVVPVELLYRDEFVYAMDMPSHSEHYLGPVHFLVIPNKRWLVQEIKESHNWDRIYIDEFYLVWKRRN